MERVTIKGLPPKRSTPDADHWDAKALEARKKSGEAILVGKGVPRSKAVAARSYRRPAFYNSDGRIQVHLRSSFLGEDGKTYGDIYLTWVPRAHKKKG